MRGTVRVPCWTYWLCGLWQATKTCVFNVLSFQCSVLFHSFFNGTRQCKTPSSWGVEEEMDMASNLKLAFSLVMWFSAPPCGQIKIRFLLPLRERGCLGERPE